jgi:hypothetical protein
MTFYFIISNCDKTVKSILCIDKLQYIIFVEVARMKLNRGKVRELMNNTCYGSYAEFGRMLGIDIAHIHKYLTSEIGGGKKVCTAVMKYCRDHGLNVYDFFILD